jgi:signal transduction histidine kinase/FixJ family two-component response regulator
MQDKRIKVLAVDDNPDNLTTLKAVVSNALPGTYVITATSGEKGMELARMEDPDVVLLDIVMPGMDGYEVCRNMKKDAILQLIPVLFLTSLKTNRQIRMKALESGAEGFLSKPFDETELIAQILSMSKIKSANMQQLHEKEYLEILVAERTDEIESELLMRRKAEQELLNSNDDLKRSQEDLMQVLEDLKVENAERRKAELESIGARKDAEAANASKSQFLANMSHELRTPMNGVMGMLQLLAMTRLDENQKEYVRLSMASSDALMVVINGILDYSRIEAGKMELVKIPFLLGRMVRDVVGLFSLSAAAKKVKLESFIEDGTPDRYVGDPFRLRQVLSNLIGNAVKFTKSGHISVSVRTLEVFPNLDARLEFVISDTGVGIPMDKMGVLFQYFSQVDNSYTRRYGGAGLGLAISKDLVEKMGGEIRVDSREGEGSRFSFTCVLALEGMPGEASAPSADTRAHFGGNGIISLLLAEDDMLGSRIIEQYVKRMGWSAKIVGNGQAAVEACTENRFDAILMDIQMPVLDGYAATGIIRRHEREKGGKTPIIAITAYALSGDKEKCLAAGMDDYLSKPIDMEEFYDIVRRWTSGAASMPAAVHPMTGKELSTIAETDS